MLACATMGHVVYLLFRKINGEEEAESTATQAEIKFCNKELQVDKVGKVERGWKPRMPHR